MLLYKRWGSVSDRGYSTPFIIVISLVCIFSLFAGFVTVKHISASFSPSTGTIEKLLSRGELEDARRRVYASRSSSFSTLILKAKVHIALTLRAHSDNQWKSYGMNPGDWLDDENSRIALELLNEAVGIDTSSAIAFALRGVVQKEMGRLSEAEMDLNKALLIDPSFTDAYSGLASLYIFQNRYSDSEKMLKTAYTYDPDNPLVSKNLGFLYRFYIQKPESSIVWLNRFLNVASPADREIGLAKSELRDMLQRYPEASSIDSSGWGQTRMFVARQKTPFK